MDGLAAAASVVAVVDMSTKVASLLFQYSKDVWNAKEAIVQLQQEVSNLKDATESVQKLLEGPTGTRLKSSQKLLVALGDSRSQLGRVEQKLDPGRARKAMRRMGLRALKWPFESKDAERMVQDLARCTQAISLSLQVDQTYVADSSLLNSWELTRLVQDGPTRSRPGGTRRQSEDGSRQTAPRRRCRFRLPR